MRDYLKKTGLTAVILITVGAIVFFQKQTAQWIILAAFSIWAIINGILFCVNHKDFFQIKKSKKSSNLIKNAEETNDEEKETKYAVQQLSHRITDKLHSAYPDSVWNWSDKPDIKLFAEGGRFRISTMNTDEFDEADIFIDAIGRIDIKMLKSNGINEIITAKSEYAETDFAIDPVVWYEQKGKTMLTELITDLNAQGAKSISIDEKGNVTLENSQQVATLEAFPTKNLWKKLIELFEAEELKSVETEDSLILSW